MARGAGRVGAAALVALALTGTGTGSAAAVSTGGATAPSGAAAGTWSGQVAAAETEAVAAAGDVVRAPGAVPGQAAIDLGATGRGGVDPGWLAVARETLADGDGWGSAGPGTTGGSAALAEDVHVVRTWDELRTALGGTDAHRQETPRIVLVEGEIRAFGFDDPGSGLPTCDDFAAQVLVADDDPRPFSMAEYVATYDPAVWGWHDPAGPMEEARARAATVQSAQVRQRVGSNVTILGVGEDARIVGAHLLVQGVSNVIVRNLRLSDAYDCFPEWDPGDTSTGNWNSLYDNLSVHTTENVWVDHVTFDDGDHPPSSLPEVFGRPFEVHDGLLDITHESDLVTVSYSVFRDHDKTNLVGSGDGRESLDGGRLRVTWHHNLWDDAGQRLPRVRFGDVDVHNNYVRVSAAGAALFDYAWGVGVGSSIWAERNVVDLPDDVPPARIVKRWGGTQLHATETLVNGEPVDVLAAYNATAAAGERIEPGARWDPVAAGVRGGVLHEVGEVREVVLAQAGSGVLRPAGEEGPGTPGPVPTDPPTEPGAPGGGAGGGAGGAGTDPGSGPAGSQGDLAGADRSPSGTGVLASTGARVALVLVAVALLAGGGAALVRLRARA